MDYIFKKEGDFQDGAVLFEKPDTEGFIAVYNVVSSDHRELVEFVSMDKLGEWFLKHSLDTCLKKDNQT